MGVFIYGRTKYCCKGNCGSLATKWTGWLRKSRDGIVAGFCDEHYPIGKTYQTFGQHNLFGIFNKGLEEILNKPKVAKYGLHKNTIEQ